MAASEQRPGIDELRSAQVHINGVERDLGMTSVFGMFASIHETVARQQLPDEEENPDVSTN